MLGPTTAITSPGTPGLPIAIAPDRLSLWGGCASTAAGPAGGTPAAANHRASVFRRHVGTALIRCDGRRRGLLDSWARSHRDPDWAQAEVELERDVSRHIGSMPFLWLAVPSRPDGSSDRGRIERNTIALLSCLTGGPDQPTASWLGHHATITRIRQSGLWNSNHVDENYDPAYLQLLANPAGNAR